MPSYSALTSLPASPAPNNASTRFTNTMVVLSSKLKATWPSSTRRKSSPALRAAPITASASQATHNVSNQVSCANESPAARNATAVTLVRRWMRSAMRRRPAGPCQHAYMLAMLASSTCAVQMFEVAFSRRMCCSRVCKANRIAGRPAVSVLTPTSRPGSERAIASLVAMNAACGPPNPIGTPKRCADPIATSAPSSPGGVIATHASKSVATTTTAPAECARSISARQSGTAPVDVGKLNSSPKPAGNEPATASSFTTSIAIPIGSARVRRTAIVCGCVSACTKNTSLAFFDTRRAIVIASAAAVASSSSDALASSKPVRSATIVWKFSKASRRPWLISG